MKNRRATKIILAALGLSGPALAHAADAPGYLMPDGAVSIIGNDGMQTLIDGLDGLYVSTHAGAKFQTTMKGSSTAMPALIAGLSLVAPMARDAWRNDLGGFKQIYGYPPTAIRIGYSGYGPRPDGKTPPAIYVNQDNPLAGLTMAQLASVLGSGAPDGDANLWSQLGLSGHWARHHIHVYGVRDDGGFASAFRARFINGLQFTPRYEALEDYKAVARAVADDPYGIGVVGWADRRDVPDRARILPLARKAGEAFQLPSRQAVAAGLYPLSFPLVLYVNKAPRQKLDPVVRDYLRLALSAQGQAIVASQATTREAYLPLDAEALKKERTLLDDL